MVDHHPTPIRIERRAFHLFLPISVYIMGKVPYMEEPVR